MASLGEHSGYMPADKAGCSRYQDWLQLSVQLNILKLSARVALIINAADGSKPQCIMQLSQRGSPLPGP
jgi:hypothetical protein